MKAKIKILLSLSSSPTAFASPAANLFLGYQSPQDHALNPDPESDFWRDDFELYLLAIFDNINLYNEFQISPHSEFLDMAIDATREKSGWNDERMWDLASR